MHLRSRQPRRHFLGTVLGATLVSPLRLRAAGEPEGRAAVIGHTGRGDYGHGLDLIFQGQPGVRVVAVADPVEEGRRQAAMRLGGVTGYADYRELLERERPQLVSVAMRHADQHHRIVLDCLRAGAHVYCEKPFTRSPAEADELLLEAERLGRRVAVAHTMRLMPVIQALKKAVDEGRLGELRELRAYGKQDARAGGEDMMVLGTHLFDWFRLFCGDPLSVFGRVLVAGRPIAVTDRRLTRDNVGWVAGDQVHATFQFRGGVQATFTSDARLPETTGHWGIELWGSRGVARMNGDLVPQVFVRSAPPWQAAGRTDSWRPLDPAFLNDPPDPQSGPVTDWLEAIRDQREPGCSARNGAWAVEMACGVYASALGGRDERFPLATRVHPLGDPA